MSVAGSICCVLSGRIPKAWICVSSECRLTGRDCWLLSATLHCARRPDSRVGFCPPRRPGPGTGSAADLGASHRHPAHDASELPGLPFGIAPDDLPITFRAERRWLAAPGLRKEPGAGVETRSAIRHATGSCGKVAHYYMVPEPRNASGTCPLPYPTAVHSAIRDLIFSANPVSPFSNFDSHSTAPLGHLNSSWVINSQLSVIHEEFRITVI